MTLAIDASTPARVSNTVGPITTATFNPPSCLLLALVGHDGSTAPTITITNNGTALTWNLIQARNSADSGGLSGHASAHYAILSGSRTGMTITASSSTSNDVTMQPYCITGADATTPIGASTEGSTTANNLTTAGFTITGTGSLGFVIANDFSALGTPTSTDCTIDTFDLTGQISGASGYKVLGSPGGSATFNIDGAGTANADWNWVSFEVLAAGGAPAAPFAPIYLTSQYGSFH